MSRACSRDGNCEANETEQLGFAAIIEYLLEKSFAHYPNWGLIRYLILTDFGLVRHPVTGSGPEGSKH